MSSKSQLEIKRHNYKVSMLINLSSQQIISMTHIFKDYFKYFTNQKKVSSVIVIYQNMTPMPHIKMIPNTKRKGRGRWRG